MDSKEVLKLYMQGFSEHLKEIRKEKYKSMDAVAQNSVFDSSNYNKYENGKGNPTIETILKMASAFRIPPRELFDFNFDIEKYNIEDKSIR
ncbi:helix-turn-helix transcriptional regulator [uncultured Chryseobacterium sp.]|uniref:helix-turn-helix domain-containing protein n=1 Tax=uncultured Chryseobacterium sp. TaxID=259322 RepID=UPI0025D354D2|nr:helix-turn-helix transcriptional regulator [uncultured Chryseobacterium sp.]